MLNPGWLNTNCAVAGPALHLDRRGLEQAIDGWRASFTDLGAKVVGLFADNGPHWLSCDLAMLAGDVVAVPLPSFFSDSQLIHAIERAGIDHVVADDPYRLTGLGLGLQSAGRCHGFELLARGDVEPVALHAGTTKITFTSGSTGTPKGVCLDQTSALRLAATLGDVLAELGITRHLSVLPFATLLENVAGAYAALGVGATVLAVPLAHIGFGGAGGFDPTRLLSCLHQYTPDSVILLPELLRALVQMGEAGAPMPGSLKFVAVGGGKVGVGLVERACALGLPVYEGYGLSECASVVSLNLPGAARPGSVGRALPHARVRLADDGEIHVIGSAMRGYLGEAPAPAEIATGDLGAFDDDGYLYVRGRKKNQFITSFGRNVNPEWPEAVLLQHTALRQAAVFGEAMPINVAVLVAAPGAVDADLDAAVQAANHVLPVYARIGAWLRADAPFSAFNSQATGNGRLRREAVAACYETRIAELASAMRAASHPG
ncbi:AMP-binding protein [Salinisphaera sp. T31B1]|uniref:AMP-binding protein n=1 Tax=Salinisphaera sp. T31B1 TaxID=727963 RepID=UPI00333F2A37